MDPSALGLNEAEGSSRSLRQGANRFLQLKFPFFAEGQKTYADAPMARRSRYW